jgi:hypothetical protein
MRPSLLCVPFLGILALGLIGCADRTDAERRAAEPSSSAASEQADADVPPATAPATPAPAGMDGPTPAAGAISYAGFGPARFGATQEAVRMAWGKDMVGGPGDPDGCYYLYPQPKAQSSYRIAFMIEHQRFARLDVDAAGIAAPGGGQVGMSIGEIRALYPGIAEQPHKYVEGGKNLRHAHASDSVLVFELDPNGKVTQWRVGVPPQVDYVEGCG